MTFYRQALASIATLTLSCSITTSFAWNAYGHRVVASVAYERLKPNVKLVVDDLIKKIHTEYPEINSLADLAIWPDAIRGQRIDAYTHWHYIDVAFSNDGTAVKNLIDTDNAAWALHSISAVLKNSHANPYERARFLAFFVHIVGDLHQPLHTVSLITASRPDGDKGGNLYYVQYNNEKTNVHKLWDEGVGAFEGSGSNNEVNTSVRELTSRYPYGSFNGKEQDVDVEHWLKEGMHNAQTVVYSMPENKVPTPNSLSSAKIVAQEEATLAGYRLAELLNSLIE